MSERILETGEWKRARTEGPKLAYSAMYADAPRGVLAIVHGYADHSARYAMAMRAFVDKGISCVGLDLRGHGHSGGDRGHALRFDEYLDDARELAALVDAKVPVVPRFLLGHSFGGVVAVKTILAKIGAFEALVLSDPYIGLALEVPALKILAGKVASAVVPGLGLPSGLTGAQMTNDAAAARAYDEDPLVFKNVRARWFTETVAAQSEILARASEITLPLFVSFGGADPVAKLETARQFFDATRSRRKQWETLEGLKHEPYSEPTHAPALAAQVASFLLAE